MENRKKDGRAVSFTINTVVNTYSTSNVVNAAYSLVCIKNLDHNSGTKDETGIKCIKQCRVVSFKTEVFATH